jgi:hypothetical protein
MVYHLNQFPPIKNIFDSQVQMQLVDTSFFRAAGATISPASVPTDRGEEPFEMVK